jgi:hypothetical protein
MKRNVPLKRTPFKQKPYPWKRVPFTAKKRDKPKETKGLFDHLKKQSKVEEWNEIREELKERFIRVGITSCELNLKNCTQAANFGFTWSFAHSLKRYDISTDPEQRAIDMREVVYACGTCHYAIESIGNKDRDDGQLTMAEIVRFTIGKRKIQP